MSGQAGAHCELVLSPSRSLVEEIRLCICPAMFLAGSSEYFSWLSEQGEEPDVGELVSRVYAAMTAQRIVRDRQMALELHEPAKLGV